MGSPAASVDTKIESCLVDRVILADFIETYKDSPCLWDRSLPLYKNPLARKKAWAVLTKKLKNLDPDANILSAKKKIENMKSAYHREMKRIKESVKTALSPEDVHQPQLWYFDMMRFLGKVHKLREEACAKRKIRRERRQMKAKRAVTTVTVSSDDDNVPLKKSSNILCDLLTSNKSTISKKPVIQTHSPMGTRPMGTPTQIVIPTPAVVMSTVTVSTSRPTSTTTHTRHTHTLTRPRSHIHQSILPTTEDLASSDSPLGNPQPSIAYGLYVAEKLDEVSAEQRVIAEKLISDVIFLARTNHLCFESRIEASHPTPVQNNTQRNNQPHLFMQIEPLVNVSRNDNEVDALETQTPTDLETQYNTFAYTHTDRGASSSSEATKSVVAQAIKMLEVKSEIVVKEEEIDIHEEEVKIKKEKTDE